MEIALDAARAYRVLLSDNEGAPAMNTPPTSSPGQEQVRRILEQWAKATQQNLRDEILRNHAPDALIYDVLPP